MKPVSMLMLLLLGASLCLSACVAMSPVVDKRSRNVVTFRHRVSGRVVTVAVADAFRFDDFAKRKHNGAEVEGYVFAAAEDDTVFVSLMSREAFQRLAGVELDASMGITDYPARTVFEPDFCQLLRARVVSLDGEVVAVTRVRALDEPDCSRWPDLKAYAREHAAAVEAFDAETDQSIRINWE